MAGAAGLLARHLSNPAFGRIANLQLWLQSPGMGTGKALPRIGSAYGLQFSQGPIMVSAHSWHDFSASYAGALPRDWTGFVVAGSLG